MAPTRAVSVVGLLSGVRAVPSGQLPARIDGRSQRRGALIEIELYGLGLDFLGRYPALIRAVTREDVQAVAQKYLDTENYALAIAGPHRTPAEA